MGFSKVSTIGWDMGPPDSLERNHFYGKGHRVNILETEESKKEVELSKGFYEWFKSKDITLEILSENSYAHEIIPRRRYCVSK